MEMVKSLSRYALIALGTWLVSSGYIDQATADSFVGTGVEFVVSLAPIAVALYWSWKKNQEPSEEPKVPSA